VSSLTSLRALHWFMRLMYSLRPMPTTCTMSAACAGTTPRSQRPAATVSVPLGNSHVHVPLRHMLIDASPHIDLP
jgi:hypothetical protein